MKIFHALLTRYNLYLEDFRNRLNDTSLELWMENRLPLFRDYCAESIRAQKTAPDLWVIGLDEDLAQFAGPIEDAIADLPFAEISFQRKENGKHQNQKSTLVRPLLDKISNYDYISTTRMDCDDILHDSFFKLLIKSNQKTIKDEPTIVDSSVTFPEGSVYFNGVFHERTLIANNFTSRLVDKKKFIEKPEKFIAFAGDHKKLKESGRPLIKIESPHPMWVQNFHDSNLAQRDGSRFKTLNVSSGFLSGVPAKMAKAP